MDKDPNSEAVARMKRWLEQRAHLIEDPKASFKIIFNLSRGAKKNIKGIIERHEEIK
jgi:hypothetical protein